MVVGGFSVVDGVVVVDRGGLLVVDSVVVVLGVVVDGFLVTLGLSVVVVVVVLVMVGVVVVVVVVDLRVVGGGLVVVVVVVVVVVDLVVVESESHSLTGLDSSPVGHQHLQPSPRNPIAGQTIPASQSSINIKPSVVTFCRGNAKCNQFMKMKEEQLLKTLNLTTFGFNNTIS